MFSKLSVFGHKLAEAPLKTNHQILFLTLVNRKWSVGDTDAAGREDDLFDLCTKCLPHGPYVCTGHRAWQCGTSHIVSHVTLPGSNDSVGTWRTWPPQKHLFNDPLCSDEEMFRGLQALLRTTRRECGSVVLILSLILFLFAVLGGFWGLVST